MNGDNANPQPIMAAVRRDAALVASMEFSGVGRGSIGDWTVPTPMPPGQADGYVGHFSNPRRFTVDLPRGGTATIVFGLGPDGRADYLQMHVWALARIP